MAPIPSLRDLETGVLEEFKLNRRVMSFDEYYELFCANPVPQCRTAPRYLKDCMEFYGVEDEGPRAGRFKLFDCPWEDGHFALVGHEAAQQEFHRVLNNFIRDGRVTRLVLLHGPNGSAKSSFIGCLARALEDEGFQGARLARSCAAPSPSTSIRAASCRMPQAGSRSPRAGDRSRRRCGRCSSPTATRAPRRGS